MVVCRKRLNVSYVLVVSSLNGELFYLSAGPTHVLCILVVHDFFACFLKYFDVYFGFVSLRLHVLRQLRTCHRA